MSIPILIVAYNRPHKLFNLLNSLSFDSERKIYVIIDGGKKRDFNHENLSKDFENLFKNFYMKLNLEVIYRQFNLGLRRNVVNSVSEVLKIHDEIIVIEEDTIINESAILFCEKILNDFRYSDNVAFVSPYNAVPAHHLNYTKKLGRYTIYPESYVWGTWARKWAMYEDNIEISINNLSIAKLRELTGGYLNAFYWRLNFLEAKMELIDTWAYRWIASIWSKNLCGINSNKNFVKYEGRDMGTHTHLKLKWPELPLEKIDIKNIELESFDSNVNKYIENVIFNHNVKFIIKRLVIFVYLLITKKVFN